MALTFEEANARYPYDAASERQPEKLRGIEKLRAFSEPHMRRTVFALWSNTHGKADGFEDLFTTDTSHGGTSP